MEYWVYLLRCRDDSLYCGVTTDLARRLREHNQGRGAKYTSGRVPVSLARAWRVNSRSEALRLEAGIKKCSRKKKEELIRSADSVRSLGFPFPQTG
ncbi:GIY-YIG nuclease superfamily protein [Peptococcaceae bacterium CEB3]|nr:GIY-YIG nuclease superfamily protein [Peptococcaceae bacterium CEB3]